MTSPTLSIDLDAICARWRQLDAASHGGVETAAVVKADAYGLGAAPIARALSRAGVRSFFVANAQEGMALRPAVGPDCRILVLAGHMPGDAPRIAAGGLIPMINDMGQLRRHQDTLPGHDLGLQLDIGMSRLGIAPADLPALLTQLAGQRPVLAMAQLSCSDEPDHPNNPAERDRFLSMTAGLDAPRSLAATAGIALGAAYHFDLARPGIGLYGASCAPGLPDVLRLRLPVIQTRWIQTGATAGYGATWRAARPTHLATLAAGYADGLFRTLSSRAILWDGGTPCPLVGRVSMDLVTVDITDLLEPPEYLDLIGPMQSADDLARQAGTIGYEILTSLGPRLARHYRGAQE